ncbi:GGDEF domain-containing protein [Methylomagnum ishizawai]|uniref:GGDEF domain-containing protein n=1 Tax=Methylomagnum ishizawai TaxID=1760988 RepID=UPI001C33E141|nr:GGDEF domain-containing protein [Methylomagnum ishizawai]BBL75490.1 diguanylate cyclase [Methylomagnum ishizawai]
MPYTPRLLDQIALLTGMRDIELLEFSLLKTLSEVTQPTAISLLRLDKSDHPTSMLHYRREGRNEINLGDIELPAEIVDLLPVVKRTRKPYSRRDEDGHFLTVYLGVESQTADSYLLVTTDHPPANDTKRLYACFLQIYQNFCALLDESQRDPLTGLPNRKTFEDSINKVLGLIPHRPLPAATPDRATPYWLGIIDIDRFKSINDTFGHLYGDEVLLLVAQLMQRHFRGGDLLFRYGGEEFVAIIAGADQEGARSAFDRLRASVAGHPFPQIGEVTISVGVVQIMPDSLTPTLLDMADRALYYAKQNGRNQVCLYEELVEHGIIEPHLVDSNPVEYF